MKALSTDQLEKFERDGFVHPIRIMTEDAAIQLRRRLEVHEAGVGAPLGGELRHKTHLLFAWLADLVHHPVIVDAVEDIYGADLWCWTTNFFIKEAHDPAFVSWHQDSTYWGLSEPDVVTAWVALSISDEESGAMAVIPGSHNLDQIPHRDTFANDNLLTRGQEVDVDVDPAQAVRIDLRPGEMSLHHVRLIHGSAPNRSDDRRIGFAIRYIPTSVRQTAGPDSATLVRGVDTAGTFEHEPRATADLDPVMIELHARATARNAAILYAGTGQDRFEDRHRRD